VPSEFHLLYQSRLVRHGSCAGYDDVHVGRQGSEVDFWTPRQRNTDRLEGHCSGDLDRSDDPEVDGNVGDVLDVVHPGCGLEDHHSEDWVRVADVIFDEIQAGNRGED